MLHLLLSGILIANQQPATTSSARQMNDRAVAAVEGDSVAAVELAWSRQPGERGATLGLATLARLTYRHGRADSLYARLLRPGTPDDEFAVAALIGLGSAHAERSNWRSADSLLNAAIERGRTGAHRALEIDALLASAQIQIRTTGLVTALARLARADSLVAPNDASARVHLMCVRAAIDAWRGLPRARLTADTGAAEARRLGQRRLESACERTVASTIEQLGFVDSASAHLGKVERLERQTHDRAGLAATLQWRGWMRLNTGDYEGGRRDLLEGIEEGTGSGNLSPVAWAHLALATLALALSDETAAAAETEQARTMFEVQGDAWGQINVQSLEARLAWRAGDLPRMRTAALRYRDGAERVGGLWRVEALRLTGILADAEGNTEAAFARLDTALSAARALNMGGRVMSVEADIARLELRSGRVTDAKRRLQHSLAITPREPHPFRYESRVALAAALLAENDVDGAEASLRAAMDTLERWRGSTSDREIRRAAFSVADDRPGEADFPAVLAGLVRGGRAHSAFEFAERRRARMLLDQLVRLSRADTLRLPRNVGGHALAIDTLRQALDDGRTAILEFATGAAAPITAFLLTRDTLIARVIAAGPPMAAAVTRLQSLVEAGAPADAPAEQLGGALLAGLLAGLPAEIERLVIVADRGLYGIPWEMLRVDGRPVVERFAVSTAPSASVFAELVARPRPSGPVSVLVFGSPYWPDVERGTRETAALRTAVREGGGLTPLPASLGEARRLRRRASAGLLRTGRNASEARLKREAPGHQIIHFATHAQVDDRGVERTALALAAGEGEDGYVTPAELAAMTLDAELLTLAACRTARGPVAGSEGVQGLAYAALEAGTRSVLASEWSVGDESSAAFMDRFYAALADSLDVGQALARAKREAAAAGLPPRDWAAFTLIGDPFVRLPLRPPAPAQSIAVIAVVAAIVLAAGYGTIVRRRTSELNRDPSARTASTRH
jgi:tetratricopeptide (TPR) repeat protein